MSGTTWLRIGAISGGLAVVAGAFGAHGLEKVLEPRAFAVFETAAKYQMYHAPALVFVGLLGMLGRSGKALGLAGWSFLLGTLLFSGSLYALAFLGNPHLGAITPFGGLFLILGWFALAVAAGAKRSVTEA